MWGAKIADYCAVVFLLRPQCLLRCDALFQGKIACKIQGDGVSARGGRHSKSPKGPKIEKFKIALRDRNFQISIEIENFKRAAQQTPIFLWGILKVRDY